MKIAVCSDLHLEFGTIELKNDGADVLILSGDICVAKDLMSVEDAYFEKSKRIHNFFKQVCLEFPHVVYVMGNHEHYHYDFKYTISQLKGMLGYLTNLHILERDVFKLDDVTFVGGTLWTDMNESDPLTLSHIKGCMNDFRCVDNSNRMLSRKVPLYEKDNEGNYVKDENCNMIIIAFKHKEYPSTFSPEDAVEEHNKMLSYIQSVVEGKIGEKFVVVGHHAPSKLSTHPRYKHETLMNGGYSSDLNDYIMDNPQIKLWTHGHTHEDFDYMLGTTRIVCNPRGYINYEARADNFKLKYVEI
jgi:hypothetical protein